MSTGTQTEVVMPQMGVSVSEGTITKWIKQVGDSVQRDEPLLEISTDKVDTEVPSPAEGVVTQILVPEGETVEVGTVLATIGPAGSEAAPPPAEPAPPAAPAEELNPSLLLQQHLPLLRLRLRLRSRLPSPPRQGPSLHRSRLPSPRRRRSHRWPPATARPSSHPSSRVSPPSMASTRQRFPAPGRVDG